MAERLRVATGGNPLAMVEIASALSAEQVSGAAALPRELPVSDPEEVFAERLATLAPDARSAARVLALAGAAPRPVLDAAAVGIPLALDDLGRLGLTVPGRETTWRHPLARSAAARGEPDEVRAAHTILARPGRPPAAAATHPPGRGTWPRPPRRPTTRPRRSWSRSRSGRRPSGPARTPPMRGNGRRS